MCELLDEIKKDEKVLKYSISVGSILFQICDVISIPKFILKSLSIYLSIYVNIYIISFLSNYY